MRYVLCLVTVLVILTACGGESNERADTIQTTSFPKTPDVQEAVTPPVSPTMATTETVNETATPTIEVIPTDTPEPADRDVTDLALGLEDMPTGWTSAPSDDSESEETFCDAGSLVEGIDPVGHVSVRFQQSTLGPSLAQNLVLAQAESDAKSAWQRVRAAFNCTEWESTDDTGETTVYHFSPLSFPNVADETYALRLSTRFALGVIEGDIVLFRSGRYVSLIAHVAVNGIDSAQTETFARTAVDKLD